MFYSTYAPTTTDNYWYWVSSWNISLKIHIDRKLSFKAKGNPDIQVNQNIITNRDFHSKINQWKEMQKNMMKPVRHQNTMLFEVAVIITVHRNS